MSQATLENNPSASMHEEVRRVKAGGMAKEDQDEGEELPRGAKAEGEEVAEAAPAQVEAVEESAPAAEPEEEIRIGGQVFKTEREAFAYAEKLEQDKLLADAHAAGVREVLESQVRAQAPIEQEESQDDFDAKFYSNPKEALRAVQAQARDEAVAVMRAEQQKEKMWSDFLAENPDVRRKDAERVLQEHWDTIGKLTDIAAGKRLLAQKVRAEYAEISEIMKPRTALSEKKASLSPSGGSKGGVTPQAKEEKVLSFAQQLRKLKG